MNNIIRKKYRFFGRVQGVGFRYRCMYTAQSLDVTGWVENLYDDSVSAEMQGTKEHIEKVIYNMKNARFIDITEIQEKDIPVIDHESSFYIK